MKKLRIIALAGCFMLLAQVGQFGVLAEEIIKEDGTVVQEEIDKEDRTVEEGTFPTEDGSVDGSGEDVDDGGNTYQVVITNPAVTWESAKAAAEAQNGYLATMTSQAEQDFLMTITGGIVYGLVDIEMIHTIGIGLPVKSGIIQTGRKANRMTQVMLLKMRSMLRFGRNYGMILQMQMFTNKMVM